MNTPGLLAQIQDWGDPSVGGGTNGCLVDGVPTLKCFEVLYSNILVMASGLAVIGLFTMLVIGSFNYLTSLGNAEKLKKAQGTIRYALIGLVIFISAFLILNTIDMLFLGGRGDIFKFKVGS